MREHLPTFLKRLILLLPLLALAVSSYAQTGRLTGSVRDAKGEPAIGATVVVKGTSIGGSVDSEGAFSINGVPNGSQTLVISSIGYASKEIPVTVPQAQPLKVALAENATGLNDVVVVGYGTQKQREVTGSVQEISAKELTDLPVAQIGQKLQGKLAGVQISQTTGTPGAGISVRIRGQASLSAGSNPLYVVDGFPIAGDINTINPDEIETITVLKDAASTSLYGSRAANGVVLITTKRARSGETNVGVNAYFGLQQVPQKGRPNMMNAQEFAQFRKEVAQENNLPVDPAYQNPEQYGEGTNWYSELLRVAKIESYGISLTGGSDKFSVSAVGGFFNQDGVLRNSNFKRFSLRINSEFKASDKVRIGFNVAPTHTVNNTPQSDGIWYIVPSIIQGALLTTPLAPARNPDGSLPLTASGPGLFGNPNWLNVLNVVKNETQTNRLLSNGYVVYEPIKGLNLKTSINVDLGQSLYNNFTPTTAGYLFNPPPRLATAMQTNLQYYSWLSENTADYHKTIGDHDFGALVGYTAQQYHSDVTNTNASNFPDDQVQTLNAATSTLTTSDIQQWTLLSYLARLNYSYKGKYLFQAAVRRDGSSRFGSESKYGNFPSVSAGWIISDEDYLKDFKALPYLKLRASYGVIGNNNIGNYTAFSAVSNTNYAFNGGIASGRSITSLGNSTLGWENTKQFDAGVDFGFFSNRLSVSYDYYNKNTDNLLYQVNVPYSSGYANYITNIGKINFWGHELAITSKNFTGDFVWTTNLNVSFNDNQVKALGTANAAIIGDYNITQVGERVGQFYGMDWQGVYKNQAEFDASPKNSTSVVGSVKFRDVNGDGVITQAGDRTALGNSVPRYLYGMTNTFGYKHFDLSIVASGASGYMLANQFQTFAGNLDGVFNVYKEVANRWKSPDNPGDGRYGTTKAGSTGPERDWFSSRFLYSANFLTIKNITLGYNVPLTSKFVRSVRLYGSVQQAFVFTKYPGSNPEVSGNNDGSTASPLNQGIDFATYPVPRTFSFGLNANF